MLGTNGECVIICSVSDLGGESLVTMVMAARVQSGRFVIVLKIFREPKRNILIKVTIYSVPELEIKSTLPREFPAFSSRIFNHNILCYF